MMSQRLVMVLALLAIASFARSDEKQDFKDYGKPGPAHEALLAFVGKWDLTVEGAKEKGTAEFKSIFGGRFVTEEAKFPLGRMTMEWLGVYGYDQHKKKYTAVWVDNMDTTTESGESEPEDTGRIFNFRGEHVDPRTGKPSKFIWRLSRQGDDRLTIEMFEADAKGKEQKVFVVRGEKRK